MAHRYDKALRDLARSAGRRVFPCNTTERTEIAGLARQIGQELDLETVANPSGSSVLVEYRKPANQAR